MMPSRGLQRAQRLAPQFWTSQRRNLSFALRTARSSRNAVATGTWPRPSAIPLALPTVVAIRHLSTNPSQPPPPPAAAEATSFPNLDTITLDNISLDAVDPNIPEHIGYLAQIGLDYGWGPTSIVQYVLEHMHITAGLPWWASIVATAVAVRVVTVPLYIKAADSSARQNALVSVTKPIQERMREAQKERRTQDSLLAYRQYSAVLQRAGVKQRHMFIPPIVQGVFGYCGFKLMNAMAKLPVPGLQDGGFLWLSDLTMTDGYLVIPLLMAGSVHCLARLGGESGSATELPPGFRSVMLYGLPAILFFITGWQPATVCLWFAGSGSVGIAQALLFRNATVREYLKIAPLYKPTKEEGSAGILNSVFGGAKESPAVNINADAFARPMYQAPNLHTSSRSRVIDTTLVNKSQGSAASPSDDMISPNAAPAGKGIFGSVSSAWNQQKQKLAAMQTEQMAAKKKKDEKRRADQYEKQAKARGR